MPQYEYAEAILARTEVGSDGTGLKTEIGYVMLPGNVVRIVAVNPTRLDLLNALGKDGWVVWETSYNQGGAGWESLLKNPVNAADFEPIRGRMQGYAQVFFLRREVH